MRTREELRAKMMQEAGEVVEELLDWHEESSSPKLVEMEEAVLRLRKRMSVRMMEVLVEEQETVRLSEAPLCEECGQRMTYKGEKSRGVGSWVGELRMKRSHYYCPGCKVGVFPPGPTARA